MVKNVSTNVPKLNVITLDWSQFHFGNCIIMRQPHINIFEIYYNWFTKKCIALCNSKLSIFSWRIDLHRSLELACANFIIFFHALALPLLPNGPLWIGTHETRVQRARYSLITWRFATIWWFWCCSDVWFRGGMCCHPNVVSEMTLNIDVS